MKKFLTSVAVICLLLINTINTWAVSDDVNVKVYLGLFGGEAIQKEKPVFEVPKEFNDDQIFIETVGGMGAQVRYYSLLCGGEFSNSLLVSTRGIEDYYKSKYEASIAYTKLFAGMDVLRSENFRVTMTGAYLGMFFDESYSNTKNESYSKAASFNGLAIGANATYQMTKRISLDGYLDYSPLVKAAAGSTWNFHNREVEISKPGMLFYGANINLTLFQHLVLYGGAKTYLTFFDLKEESSETRKVQMGNSGVTLGAALRF